MFCFCSVNVKRFFLTSFDFTIRIYPLQYIVSARYPSLLSSMPILVFENEIHHKLIETIILRCSKRYLLSLLFHGDKSSIDLLVVFTRLLYPLGYVYSTIVYMLELLYIIFAIY